MRLYLAIVNVMEFNALPARYIIVHSTSGVANMCYQTSAAKMFE